jgi:hypothetical protein
MAKIERQEYGTGPEVVRFLKTERKNFFECCKNVKLLSSAQKCF